MKRQCYQQVIDWMTSASRKPLILLGARQVGKTYLLNHFGQEEFEQVIYANFEEDENLHQFFHGDLHPSKIIRALEIYFNTTIHAENTLIIFDEIQECPKALTSLKYFCEQANEYYIAAAGSLLGIKVGKQSGFPVGKVNLIYLYPLSFLEFLTALGNKKLAEYLASIDSFVSIPQPLHTQAMEYFRLYTFIGGMPEVVAMYCNGQNLMKAREVQETIIKTYEFDFSKHAPSNQITKITQVWHSIPEQLAKENKKFIYSIVRAGARAREYESAIQWLIDAGLIYRCANISAPKLPLPAYSSGGTFKMYLFDVGILGAMSRLSSKVLLQPNVLFTEFKGALTENVVAQMLKISGHRDLFYWTSANTAEVDFIVPLEMSIIPLEVKAGKSSKKKSLHVYIERYHPKTIARTSPMNLRQDGDISNYPFYLMEHFPFNS